MMLLFLLSVLYLHITTILSISTFHSLSSSLHYFETLHKNDLHHEIKYDNMPRLKDNLREIKFTTHGRPFRLLLNPTTESFHPFLQARSYNQNGYQNHPIHFDHFLEGHVFGEESSHVTCHVTEEGVVTGVIRVASETYYIEPSHRHIKESHDYHMISYKASDVKFNMTKENDSPFCGVSSHIDHTHFHKHSHFVKLSNDNMQHNERVRLKRQTSGPETVCPINLIATNSFYESFGGTPNEPEQAINYLLLLLVDIDKIFRNTDFYIPGVQDSASRGSKGLQIANVTIITEQGSNPSYNADSNRNSEKLLEDFSSKDWDSYCLAHLFIARPFTDGGRLGVAYVADANSFIAGGICSQRTNYRGQPFSGNTGASTFRTSSNRLLLFAESVIVTAHEIGHSWGSQHDDTSMPECNPSQDEGGKFLMYPIAQDGSAPNNNNFSSCSIRAISRVLSTHESNCFTVRQDDQCGDFRVGDNEQCDPGPSAVLNNGDRCCTVSCTFKQSNYTCSDTNHDCCNECTPKSQGTICLEVETGNSACLDDKICNGVDINCPNENRYVSNGTSCGFRGICIPRDESNPDVTECKNFCEQNNLITCHCTDQNECKICCRRMNGTCQRYPDEINLPQGSYCEGGTCDQNGQCQLSDSDLVTYLFDLFNNFSPSAFVRVLRQNIVGSVIIISLIFWIPISAGVHVFDIWWEKRREKQKINKKLKIDKKQKSEESEKLIPNDDIDCEKDQGIKFKQGMDPEYDNIKVHVEKTSEL